MEITCNICGKTYKIDDSKVPKTGKVFVKCAACQGKIEISPKKFSTSSFDQNEKLPANEPPIEYFDPDTKTALIYCQDVQAKLEMEKKLAELEFETRSIKDEADIRHHFKFNIFDLIILYQQGPDQEEQLKAILDYINNMPAHMRRKTLVIYIHLSGHRYDLYDAFSRGVDSTLSPMDISSFSTLIPKIMEQKEHAYKVFFDCQAKVEESVI